MKYLFALLLLMPFAGFAQLQLTGKVVNANDGKAIPDASIFLNNTTTGTKAAADGSFTLYNLRSGQYELVVSVVGFDTYRNTVMVSKNTALPDIKMVPKTMELKVVRIGADPKWARKLRIFKESFLGRSAFAGQCTILNPGVLYLRFSKDEKQLKGNTDDFLEIVNDALGYKLKYLVSSFVLNRDAANVGYEGPVLFEESEGTNNDKVRWEKNRRAAYFGSPTHFLREILANRVNKDFMVRPYCIREINNNKNFIYDTLRVADYVHRTDEPGIFAINYPGNLDVFYYPPGTRHSILTSGREHGNRGQIGNIIFLEPNMFFDSNGSILNPTGTLFKYTWGLARVAELLPVDYYPKEVAKGLTQRF